MPEQLDLISVISTAHPILANDKERFRRALAFATMLGMHCSNLLTGYIEHCRKEAMPGAPEPAITQTEFSYCVKTLMCVSLWLVLLEQQFDIPDDMRKFVLDAMNVSDRLYELPPAKTVMTNYDVGSGPQTIRESASFNICLRLNLGGTAPDALVQLAEALKDVRHLREDIMRLSLTKSISELDEIIGAAE